MCKTLNVTDVRDRIVFTTLPSIIVWYLCKCMNIVYSTLYLPTSKTFVMDLSLFEMCNKTSWWYNVIWIIILTTSPHEQTNHNRRRRLAVIFLAVKRKYQKRQLTSPVPYWILLHPRTFRFIPSCLMMVDINM